jgi:hypothetical protein
MPSWLQTLVASVSGGLLVVASNYLLFHLREAKQSDRELTAAIVEFMAVVDQMGHEVRVMPEQTQVADAVQEALKQVPTLDAAVRGVSQRLWTPHLRGLTERFYVAGARLSLVAPKEILESSLALAELLTEAEERPPNWIERWDNARGAFLVTCRAELGKAPLPNRVSAEESSRG